MQLLVVIPCILLNLGSRWKSYCEPYAALQKVLNWCYFPLNHVFKYLRVRSFEYFTESQWRFTIKYVPTNQNFYTADSLIGNGNLW